MADAEKLAQVIAAVRLMRFRDYFLPVAPACRERSIQRSNNDDHQSQKDLFKRKVILQTHFWPIRRKEKARISI